MDLRNIHFDGGEESPVPAPTAEAVAAALPERMRLRKVSVSPLEELALRAGEVRPISDALAAMILCLKGRAMVTAKGIKVDRDDLGGVRYYWHLDSRICGDLGSRERKWFYVINRHLPDRVHLLDDAGRYVETLPEAEKPPTLDNKAQARVYAEHKEQMRRSADHLQRLHGKDTQAAIETARTNADNMTRYVQTLDAADTMPAGRVEPAPSSLGDRLRQANHRIAADRTQRASAVALGAALSRSRTSDLQPDVAAEEWSDTPRTPQTSIPTESW